MQMTQGHSDQSTFRVSTLAAWLLIAIACGCALGLVAGLSRDGTNLNAMTTAALEAGVAWALATGLGLVALQLLTGGKVAQLGTGVLASSTVRMLGGLGLALLVYFGLRVGQAGAGVVFWFGVLGSGLATLVVESAWAVSKLRTLTVLEEAARGAPAHR